jgi:hypothetical protein
MPWTRDTRHHRSNKLTDNTGLWYLREGVTVQLIHSRHAFYGEIGKIVHIKGRRVKVRIYLEGGQTLITTWANHRSVLVHHAD